MKSMAFTLAPKGDGLESRASFSFETNCGAAFCEGCQSVVCAVTLVLPCILSFTPSHHLSPHVCHTLSRASHHSSSPLLFTHIGRLPNMQTRKKSISLHALGIIPAARVTHRSASSSSANNTPSTDSPPAKRLKRSHTLSTTAPSSNDPASPSPPSHRRRNASSAADKQRPQPASQTTPPPSPGDFPHTKVDTAGINDDVVVAVIEQLASTGNRPHQIKELATVLAGNTRVVDRYVSSSSQPNAKY